MSDCTALGRNIPRLLAIKSERSGNKEDSQVMYTNSLLRTTALTGLVALVPFVFAMPADAGIKIKPQTHVKVNVKPKVKVAPKIKVKAAKIRIKTKPRTTKKVAKDPTSKTQTNTRSASTQPKITPQPERKNPRRPIENASLDTGSTFNVGVPERRPDRNIDTRQNDRFTVIDELGQARAAAEAARMLEELGNVAALGKLRDAATVNAELGDSALDQGSELSNRDQLGTPDTGNRGGMFENYQGPGADEFAEIENSHGSGPANSAHQSHLDAVNAYYDINRSISQGLGGIASNNGGHNPNDVDSFETRTDGNTSTYVYNYERSNGTKVTEIVVIRYGGGLTENSSSTTTDETMITTNPDGRTEATEVSEFADSEYDDPVETYSYSTRIYSGDNAEPVVHHGTGSRYVGSLDELRDPDSGYGGSSPFPWINEREKPTTDLTTAGNGKTPGAMPQDPYSDQVNTRQVQASVTQDRVLETWDEDNRRSGAPQPIDGCFHSEC